MSRMINGIYVIEPEEPQLCEVCGELKEAKNNRTVLNIRVKGNGISTRFTCLSGDRVIEVQQHK